MELFRQLVHKHTNGRTLLVPKVAIATEKKHIFEYFIMQADIYKTKINI